MLLFFVDIFVFCIGLALACNYCGSQYHIVWGLICRAFYASYYSSSPTLRPIPNVSVFRYNGLIDFFIEPHAGI